MISSACGVNLLRKTFRMTLLARLNKLVRDNYCVHSKNKWCSEGPYRVLHVVPNTGPYSVLQGTLVERALKDPMLGCSEAPLRGFRAPHIRFLEAPPIVALEPSVLTCRRLREIYIMTCGSFRGPILSCGCFVVPYSMAYRSFATRGCFA